MRARNTGRHELGQNYLHDFRTISTIVKAVAETDGPIVEWAAGDGALTVPLARLRRPVTAVEIDDRRVRALARRVGPHVCVVRGDILRHAPPYDEYTLVSNLPFHLTTPALRRALCLPGWNRAVLLTQWEVAKKRAAIGGTTLLTAQWWPWFEFDLLGRVPANAFRPAPSVDGGILSIRRRTEPQVGDRAAYQRFVADVFAARGRTITQMTAAVVGCSTASARRWALRAGLAPHALPRDLDAVQWVSAFDFYQHNRVQRR